jgi:hypothetical protein
LGVITENANTQIFFGIPLLHSQFRFMPKIIYILGSGPFVPIYEVPVMALEV